LENSEQSRERAKHLFLSLLQARVGSSLVSRLGNLAPEAVLETPFSELAGWTGISEKAARSFDELRRFFDARAVEDRLGARGIKVLTLADEGYPAMLRNIPDPPPALYSDGSVPETVSVALVGSRKASATGVETARRLGSALAERGVCVVSGLALGVDAAAHEGAVDAGGPTVGVLGCGIDVTYPTKYKRSRVALPRQGLRGPHVAIRTDEGLAMDRFPYGSAPRRSGGNVALLGPLRG
jgi:DNA processing protein